MGGVSLKSELQRLRERAEEFLRDERHGLELTGVLEKIVAMAIEGTEDSLFAHRHLAEICIERNPWDAALHLRKVLAFRSDDDIVQALMGLCHALLGNYRAAVSAYRKALIISPRNPWYHHNLGHLLDVALNEQKSALVHLRTAHEIEPLEDEITASLAHCLARLSLLEEARALASESLDASPRNVDHQALLEWISRGAPAGEGPHDVGGQRAQRPSAPIIADPNARGPRSHEQDEAARAVLELLENRMREAGFSTRQLERARTLWSDFQITRRSRVLKPEVAAAAVEYAIVFVNDLRGVTRAQVARRYGVTVNSLVARYSQIRDALRLNIGDPRYEAASR